MCGLARRPLDRERVGVAVLPATRSTVFGRTPKRFSTADSGAPVHSAVEIRSPPTAVDGSASRRKPAPPLPSARPTIGFPQPADLDAPVVATIGVRIENSLKPRKFSVGVIAGGSCPADAVPTAFRVATRSTSRPITAAAPTATAPIAASEIARRRSISGASAAGAGATVRARMWCSSSAVTTAHASAPSATASTDRTLFQPDMTPGVSEPITTSMNSASTTVMPAAHAWIFGQIGRRAGRLHGVLHAEPGASQHQYRNQASEEERLRLSQTYRALSRTPRSASPAGSRRRSRRSRRYRS